VAQQVQFVQDICDLTTTTTTRHPFSIRTKKEEAAGEKQRDPTPAVSNADAGNANGWATCFTT
jgi:hypothetical protein